MPSFSRAAVSIETTAAAVGLMLAAPAPAQVADQASSSIPTVVITSQHLNEERSRIDTDTGASTYKFDSKATVAGNPHQRRPPAAPSSGRGVDTSWGCSRCFERLAGSPRAAMLVGADRPRERGIRTAG